MQSCKYYKKMITDVQCIAELLIFILPYEGVGIVSGFGGVQPSELHLNRGSTVGEGSVSDRTVALTGGTVRSVMFLSVVVIDAI